MAGSGLLSPSVASSKMQGEDRNKQEESSFFSTAKTSAHETQITTCCHNTSPNHRKNYLGRRTNHGLDHHGTAKNY